MRVIHVHVPGVPYTGGNVARVVPRVTRGGQRLLVPVKTKQAQQFARNCQVAALAVRPARPLQGPVAATVCIWLRAPARRPVGFPDGREGDLDGFLKPLFDGLTKGQIWADDGQVVDLVVRKRFGPRPGVGVWVTDAVGGFDALLAQLKISLDMDCPTDYTPG